MLHKFLRVYFEFGTKPQCKMLCSALNTPHCALYIEPRASALSAQARTRHFNKFHSTGLVGSFYIYVARQDSVERVANKGNRIINHELRRCCVEYRFKLMKWKAKFA